MNRPFFPAIGLIALTSPGCSRDGAIPDGLPEVVADELRFCAELPDEVRDACTFNVISRARRIDAAAHASLCQGMHAQGPRDACIEAWVREHNTEATPADCEQIAEPRFRASCLLALAGAVMRRATDMRTIVETCMATGVLMRDCIQHIPDERRATWAANGGLPSLVNDIRQLMQLVPQAGAISGLGERTADAAMSIGMPAGRTEICELFGPGNARDGCMGSMTGPQSQRF